jgi:hypothetical protein
MIAHHSVIHSSESPKFFEYEIDFRVTSNFHQIAIGAYQFNLLHLLTYLLVKTQKNSSNETGAHIRLLMQALSRHSLRA